jgi:hypothetical protein
MKKTLIFLALTLQIFSLKANYLDYKLSNDSLLNKKNVIIVEYQRLRSTHSTIFNGFNITYAKQVSEKGNLGIGIEYSYASFHGDNGYNLYNLKFVPIYLGYRYDILTNRKLIPFLLGNVGYTFSGYDEEEDGKPQTRHRIKEGGLYLNGAFGAKYRISRTFVPIISLGFKGFKNSLNNLDVNPHGFVIRTGLLININ